MLHRFCVAKLQQELGYGPTPPWSSYGAGDTVGRTAYNYLCRTNRPGDLRAMLGVIGVDGGGHATRMSGAALVALVLRRNALVEPGRAKNPGLLVHVFDVDAWARLHEAPDRFARLSVMLAFDADELTIPAVKHSNGAYRTLVVPTVTMACEEVEWVLDGMRTGVRWTEPYPDIPDRPPRKAGDPRWAVRAIETENAARRLAESWESLPGTATGVWVDLASGIPARSPLA